MSTSRTITGSIVIAAMFLQTSVAVAASYSSNSKTETAISYVKRQGIMTGYDNGSFGENNSVKRVELAKVITLIDSSNGAGYTMRLPFWDTSNTAWYTPYVVYVYGNGFMTGYSDNSFRPDQAVTFAEAAKVLALAYNMNVQSNSNRWYEAYIRALDDRNAIPTSINDLNDPLTRGELADIIYRLETNNRNLSSQTYSDVVNGNDNNDNDCYYDSNGRYRCDDNNYNNGCDNDDLAVYIDADDNNVQPGDDIRYTIEVENCSGSDQRVDVAATLDSQVTFESGSNGADLNGRRVDWDNIRIDDGDTETLTLRVSVRSYAGSNDSIDLSVRAQDDDRNSVTETHTVYLSNSSNNDCYYDSNNRYRCDDNNDNDCYYDNNNRYICDDNNDNNCYYDSNNRYRCDDDYNDNNDCYYNSNGRYICDNDDSYDDCYYDSNNRYICDNNNNNDSNCYYDGSGRYRCDEYNDNNDCYYDSNGRYRCDNNADDCYYDSNNRYRCDYDDYNYDTYYDEYNQNNDQCYYDNYNRYVCY